MSFHILIYEVIASAICQPAGAYPGVVKIGTYAKATPVTVSTYVPIDAKETSAVSDAGRIVNVNVTLNGHGADYDYYYTAWPGDGIITEIREIRNDVDSLVYMTNQLEYYWNQFSSGKESVDDSAMINDVIGYVRTINNGYCSSYESSTKGKWMAFCGNYNLGYNQYIDNDMSHGLSFYSYFSSFLDSESKMGGEGHPGKERTLAYFNLFDPVTKKSCIDLTHMFASMDGNYAITGGFLNGLSALTSWAGDLQTSAKQKSAPINDFTEILSFKDSLFPFSDLYADIDGSLIGKRIDDYNDVSDAISNYYYEISPSTENRFYDFVADFNNGIYNETAISNFKEVVYFYMHLKNSGGVVSDITSTDDILKNIPVPDDWKEKVKKELKEKNPWALLDLDNTSFECRKSFGEKFIAYVLASC